MNISLAFQTNMRHHNDVSNDMRRGHARHVVNAD